MYMEELKEVESGCEGNDTLSLNGVSGRRIAASDAKRVLIGAGARVLFYPTLLYNVLRNKFQTQFRWWDRVDEFVLLGAVPFPSDVARLRVLDVQGVITLNEPYETLVPTSLYQAYGIDHLVIPTRDYLFAPSMVDICKAVDFIHGNSLGGYTTYVHCKAGRGRSTTVVICYLMTHKKMTPDTAFSYVRSIRPRVQLASSQWQAVQKYYQLVVKRVGQLTLKDPNLSTSGGSCEMVAFDEGSVVMVTESDIDGYEAPSFEVWADLSFVCKVRVAGQAALARISCSWVRCGSGGKVLRESLMGSVGGTSHLAGLDVDIRVC